jgi:valyl-tRNA synthetase
MTPTTLKSASATTCPASRSSDDDGTMTEEAGRFEGLDRFECRKAVVEEH